MTLLSSRCIVIKIGSSLLINETNNSINAVWLNTLIEDVVLLLSHNINVILVSSGAIAYGKIALNITSEELSVDKKQAAAAIGQIQLLHQYQTFLNQHQLKGAQVLLNSEDTNHTVRRNNIRSTLKQLLEMNIIPIINENDSVATVEMRYGDNDQLAANVAELVNADTLILLSDIDGLYTDDPRINSSAQLISLIEALNEDILAMAKNSSTDFGSGGMITKLKAAEIAMKCGCNMLITLGKTPYPIKTFLASNKGTWFKSNQ
jgi:glutamate 5-kinase